MADQKHDDTAKSKDTDLDKEYHRMIEEKNKCEDGISKKDTWSGPVNDEDTLKDRESENRKTFGNGISTRMDQNDKVQITINQEEIINEDKKKTKEAKDTIDGTEAILSENVKEYGKQSTITTEKVPNVDDFKEENTDLELSQSIQSSNEAEASATDIQITNESTQIEDDNGKSAKCIPLTEQTEDGGMDDTDSIPSKIQRKDATNQTKNNKKIGVQDISPKPVKEKIAMVKKNHIIGFALSLTIFISGFYVIPIPTPIVNTFAERLTFTFRWLFFSSFTVIHGIILVAGIRVKTPAIDPLNGNMEHLVEVPNRYLRNTVEQIILHIFGMLMLSSYLKPESMKAIPVLVFLFIFGRVLYWQGYSKEAMRRGVGFVLSFYPTMIVYLYCTGCFVLQGQGFGF